MKHELVQLAGKVDWNWIDGEIAPLYSENGRPGIETRSGVPLYVAEARQLPLARQRLDTHLSPRTEIPFTSFRASSWPWDRSPQVWTSPL
jgi:hypothetical protein